MHIEQSDFHDQLVRGLAHKMNNILSLFQGYLGLLLEDKKLDADTLDGLARIREGAHAASELMDRTRAFTKPTSTIWREVEMTDFLRQMTPTLESFQERGSTLEIQCEENLPRLWVESSRLRTALVELVRNAFEASPTGGLIKVDARIEVRPSRTKIDKNPVAEPIQWVALTVSDEGEGLTAEIAKKIYQPFFTTKQKKNAMGLGLSVALGFMQQLGGGIRFSSKGGRTTFRLLLPCRSERTGKDQ